MIEKKSGKSRNDSDHNVCELKLMRNYFYRILRYTVLYRFTTFTSFFPNLFYIYFISFTSTSCFVNLERL